ncbi:unnamed protein product [Acanthoscelides obtectus]|uniref:Uncharacterized protein n=1 Tax=Acanthoscelides obtectus TaxID=200917 RepID=A0A9P0LSB5_ACAOB|nr:unnamed protein product [Acanthoscelides obtectus]CAK1668521.1 hypothetical protein AOBTE_LOCUS26456 [Acanthoscelides obtectus]
MECKVKDLIEKLEETPKDFERHVNNIKTQYKNHRECIDEDEIALHIDFSGNNSCKQHEEIQLLHFGG